MVISGMRGHLDQVADLAIVAENFRADHQMNPDLGILVDQLLNGFRSRIFRIAYAKNDLVFGIVLNAVAAKTFIHPRINPTQRLENGDWRREFLSWLANGFPERASAPQAQRIKSHPAQ